MRNLGVFSTRGRDDYQRGMSVIARTNRGLETGFVLCGASEDALSHLDQPPTGQILREMSDDDAHELAHLQSTRQEKLDLCQKHIDPETGKEVDRDVAFCTR